MGEKSYMKDVKIFEALWSLAPHVVLACLIERRKRERERERKGEKNAVLLLLSGFFFLNVLANS